jgi:hypothetical protein
VHHGEAPCQAAAGERERVPGTRQALDIMRAIVIR